MRSLGAAVCDIDQETVAEFLLDICVPLLRVSVRIAEDGFGNAVAEQRFCITRVASGRLKNAVGERIVNS